MVLARYGVAGKGESEVNVGQLQSCYVLCLSLLSVGGRRLPLSVGGWAGIAKQQTEECTQDSRGGGDDPASSPNQLLSNQYLNAYVVSAHNVNN
jgi:hypothetical protein